MNESLLYILGILIVALGIGLSIGWHELGHLIPAKLFGVKVPKYMIGFGPTLFSRKIGETEYGVKLIPLGGYISMIGMYPPAKDASEAAKRGFFRDMITSAREAHSEYVEPGDENRKFYQLSVRRRMVIMLGGPFMNLILGVILLTITLSGIGVSQISTTIDQVAPCVSLDPNLECGKTDVATESPALAAGLKSGDKIIAINGVTLSDWKVAANLIKPDVANAISVRRTDGSEKTISVTPVTVLRPVIVNGVVKRDAKGVELTEPKPVLGIILATEVRPLSLGESLAASGQSIVQVGQMILNLPQQVVEVGKSTFGSDKRTADGPVSVIG
ncbi:MAG: M50 family metallopeptidase, partial [Rhodoluna sp.]